LVKRNNTFHCILLFALWSFILSIGLLSDVFASQVVVPHTVKTSVLAVTVSEAEISSGSVVGISLEIVSGSGRVFIDTFPAAKIDTQVSARIAKDIACYYAGIDCSEIDFIYTIESQVSQISGPSAGVSLTALTYSALTRLPLLEGVVATGTINSGGFVGSVGGISQKIQAAASQSMNTVLIPYGEEIDQQHNMSYIDYGKSVGVNVVAVSDFSQVLELMTGAKVSFMNDTLLFPTFYSELMSGISVRLCDNAKQVLSSVSANFSYISQYTLSQSDLEDPLVNESVFMSLVNSNSYRQYLRGYELYNRSIQSLDESDYYSAASYCYGSLIDLYELSNVSTDFFSEHTQKLYDTFSLPTYETYADFLTYMLVQERVLESKKLFNQSQSIGQSSVREVISSVGNISPVTQANVSTQHNVSLLNQTASVVFDRRLIIQAYLRMQTALEWATFFTHYGSPVSYTDIRISHACQLKILEILDRKNYISTYTSTVDIDSRISSIRQQSDMIMCLYDASKLKAEMDVAISTYGLTTNVSSLLSLRAKVVERLLVSQTLKKHYPIISYSYYQYALSLVEYDPASALLYLQYALELADLPVYLGTQSATPFVETTATFSFIKQRMLREHSFTLGFCAGLIVCILCIRFESFIRTRFFRKKEPALVGKKLRK
jgi:predicted S18 family serine protease